MRLSAWPWPWLGILAAAITIGAASEARATPIYWNLFNIEGENSASAGFITYDSQIDMLLDVNRTGFYQPNGQGAGRNVVGSGATVMAMTDPGPMTTVPEPASIALFALGLLGFTPALRRNRARQGRMAAFLSTG